MTTHPIVPEVLGHAAEAAGARELTTLGEVLRTLTTDDWQRETPSAGGTVATVVAHLAGGATRLADAWRRRLDPEPVTLQHPIHDPTVADDLSGDDDPEALLVGYQEAVGDLLAALGTCRTDDWSWPVWSPLGGTETLASAARRWVAHHRVHHHDILGSIDRRPLPDGDTDDLVSEFVLDALARRGGPAVTPPLVAEVVVSPPGSGTWTVYIDAEPGRQPLPTLWEEIVSASDVRDRFRIERGAADLGGLIVRTDGETLWRAAFRRGAAWSDLEVHGDDQSKSQWRQLVEALSSDKQGIGTVQS